MRTAIVTKSDLFSKEVCNMAGKLYIALEDLKDRYKCKEKGPDLIRAYVQSVKNIRSAAIQVIFKDNKTVEFVISGSLSRNSLREIKRDLKGELCVPNSANKYEQPSRYLPPMSSIHTKLSDEVCREMNPDDQRRLQQSDSPINTLTIEALEKHDSKHMTGPCQLRQFGCGLCMHSWWHNVLKTKPVSRCNGGKCGNQRYDALPRQMEFGIGRFICPGPHCGRRFFGHCEATTLLRCRKCGNYAMPYIHPKWRKRRANWGYTKPRGPRPSYSDSHFKQLSRNPSPAPELSYLSLANVRSLKSLQGPESVALSQSGASDTEEHSVLSTSALELSDCDALSQCSSSSQQSSWYVPSIRSTCTVSDSDTVSEYSYSSVVQRGLTTNSSTPRSISSARSSSQHTVQPLIKPPCQKKRIFNASKIHQPTGGTISTFLTQVDFEITGEDVVLDYDNDEDEDSVGLCKFECLNCENEYTVICRMGDTAECYNCHEINRPLNLTPLEDNSQFSQRGADCNHSCSRCNGEGRCPNLS